MIVPSIDLQDGRAVQLRRGREFVLDGGDPLERLETFAPVGEVAVVDLDAALGRGSNADVIRAMIRRHPCRVGGGIRDLESARRWLDDGATRIVVGTAATPEFCRALPRERVIAAVDAEDGTVVVEGWRTRTNAGAIDRIRELAPHVGGFLLTQVEHEGGMAGFDRDLVAAAVEAAGDARVTAAGGVSTLEDVAALDAAGADAQVGMALYTGTFTAGQAFAAALRRPVEGGVWPTIVCDEGGHTLGLVWSTRDTIAEAVDTRRGIYWSRSRGERWVKGETSGNTQRLLRAALDCDRDAIRVTVRQEGRGFCHAGTRTCWGDPFTLPDLERVISDRARTGDEGSGTARLLGDDRLLAAKLREEADELGRAASGDNAVHETADLLYFALVALASHGRSLDEVVEELALRHRRVTRRPMAPKAPFPEDGHP